MIRTYETQFVPGLLQTVDYARAVVRIGQVTLKPEEVERRVELRMDRQRIVTRPRPVRLWAVLDEAVLRRPVGGPKVMRGQIEALIELSGRQNITLQVIPFKAGGHAATGGSFSLLRFPERDMSDVVYIEHMTSALYLDKRDDLDIYATAMDSLCVEADPPNMTADILADVLGSLEHR